MPKIDVAIPTTSGQDERGKRWVEVPEKDLFDFPHPVIRINLLEFGPGKHFVEANVADWIEERLRRKYQSDIRVMRPQQDYTSQNAMTRFGAGARTGGFSKNPEADFA